MTDVPVTVTITLTPDVAATLIERLGTESIASALTTLLKSGAVASGFSDEDLPGYRLISNIVEHDTRQQKAVAALFRATPDEIRKVMKLNSSGR
jgi:hypothetical protein